MTLNGDCALFQADISARISSQDKKMATLEDRILNSPATVTCVKPVSMFTSTVVSQNAIKH